MKGMFNLVIQTGERGRWNRDEVGKGVVGCGWGFALIPEWLRSTAMAG